MSKEALSDFLSEADWPAYIRVEDGGWLFNPDIVDDLPVWEWADRTGIFTTRVCLTQVGHQVHWQVWQGDTMLSDRPTLVRGVKEALHMINGWRRAGADETEVRRVVHRTLARNPRKG